MAVSRPTYSSMRQVRAVEGYMSNLAETLEVLERQFRQLRVERDRLKTRLYYSNRDARGRFVKRGLLESEGYPAPFEGLLNDVLPEQ